jgi:holo-[acyl-carrier protein] synthase
VFTEAEVRSCPDEPTARDRALAECFAAKEAAIKVLLSGDMRLDWRSIEVQRDETGRFRLRLSGEAAELARRAGITWISLSLSQAGPLAMAVAVANAADGPV